VWLIAVLLLSDSASTTRELRIPVAPSESLAVQVAGRATGAPVVLVPGLFGSAFGFRKLVPLLTAAGYRVVVVEPLGIGSSSRPRKANYSLTAQAGRIAAVLDSLRVRGVLLVAHSIGGSEAFRLAYHRPDLVRGLVMFGSPVVAPLELSGLAARLARWLPRAAAWGIPGVLDADCLTGPCHDATVALLEQPLEVPALSLYSRCDGVVAWRACLEQLTAKAENVEDKDRLNRLLQELAWDAVTHHPLTGLGAGTSGQPRDGAK
jgi:pimeloyl-ACP methyl ester carboxylesterase